MFVKLICGALQGLDAYQVSLEVEYRKNAMPNISIVGLPEGAVKEARDRVQAAIRFANYKFPQGHFVINLAPADKRKTGTSFDLAMAVGILSSSGLIPVENTQNWFMAGELSLNGDVQAVSGILALAILARNLGCKGMLTSKENAIEASVVEGLDVYAVDNLNQLISFINGEIQLETCKFTHNAENFTNFDLDYFDVKGQENAKRAVEIAAAGAHNILLIGPPGSGKTMLAKRLPTILPPLSFEEALEVTKIYSVANKLEGGKLITKRPFRSPHHTISEIALVGGGTYPKPGELSNAHRGVLFLDELPEYTKQALEVLRQPLEDGIVTISRASQSLSFPSDCMLVAAMNPCPCGYYGDPKHSCTCNPKQIAKYRSKLSGPLLDRIDLHVEVPAVSFEELNTTVKAEYSSDSIRTRVLQARKLQNERYKNTKYKTNADLAGKLLNKYCALGESEYRFVKSAVEELALSARAYTRILRIARTIADLELAESIKLEHLAEAISFRCFDRKFS